MRETTQARFLVGGGGVRSPVPRGFDRGRAGSPHRSHWRSALDRWGCAFMAGAMKRIRARIEYHERARWWSRTMAAVTGVGLGFVVRVFALFMG